MFHIKDLFIPTAAKLDKGVIVNTEVAQFKSAHAASFLNLLTFVVVVVVFHSGSANNFLYTRQGRSPVIDGVDDTKELCTTRNAFTLLGNIRTLTNKHIYSDLSRCTHSNPGA